MAEKQRPVLVFAPLAGDGETIAGIAEESGFSTRVCRKLDEFSQVMKEEDPLCAVISQEAAGAATAEAIESALAQEPAWSTVPLIFIVRDTEAPPPACRAMIQRKPPAAVIIMQSPVRPMALSLVLANQVQLRHRQFQTAELLQKLEDSERYQKFLLSELRHRTRNTLSLIEATARITARRHETIEGFREALSARVRALSEANSLLAESETGEVALRTILSQHVEPYAPSADGLQLEGPEVAVVGRKAFDLGLIVHELATNAAKYGAFSVDGGIVRISWQVAEGALSLRWAETGGPTVEAPERTSFGSQMIDELSRRHGATSRITFEPTGLVWEFHLPSPDDEHP